jgi:hypothetical protein
MLSSLLRNSTSHVGKSPIDKTIVLNCKEYIAVVEYTDGVIEQQERECVHFTNEVIKAVNQSFDTKTKKKFYFKPLYSKSLSSSTELFLSNQDWEFNSIHPWSYYSGNYAAFFHQRNEIRKAIKTESKNEITFFGRFNDSHYSKIDYPLGENENFKTKRSYHSDCLKEEDIVSRPSRKQRIQNFEKAHDVKVKLYENVCEGIETINAMKNAKILLQPHGISVRHNIYEGMMLGINSIVETTSYNPALFNMFHQYSFDEMQC